MSETEEQTEIDARAGRRCRAPAALSLLRRRRAAGLSCGASVPGKPRHLALVKAAGDSGC